MALKYSLKLAIQRWINYTPSFVVYQLVSNLGAQAGLQNAKDQFTKFRRNCHKKGLRPNNWLIMNDWLIERVPFSFN